MGRSVEFEVERVRTRAQLADALALRQRVFVEEQRVPVEEEVDAYDALPDDEDDGNDGDDGDDGDEVSSALHVLARCGDLPVATGRLLLDYPPGENAHIGRVAVLEEFRRQAAGVAIMRALQQAARELGRPGITLAAQLSALPFYEELGYTAHGEIFLDANIEHRWMTLRFNR